MAPAHLCGQLQIGIQHILVAALFVGIYLLHALQIAVQPCIDAVEYILHVFVIASERLLSQLLVILYCHERSFALSPHASSLPSV